jgi:hypothetical protein
MDISLEPSEYYDFLIKQDDLMGVSYTETEDCMKLHLVRNEMLLNK